MKLGDVEINIHNHFTKIDSFLQFLNDFGFNEEYIN